MSLIGSLIIFAADTTILSAQVNQNLNDIKVTHNGNFDATTGHKHTGAAGDAPKIDLTGLNLPELTPIGSIIPHYDFNGGLTFDTNKWAYCNGQSKNITGLVGPQVLPDLSGRYVVGFGTDGAGDLASAAWATTPVGNTGHLADTSHSHVVNAHAHDMVGHTHSMPHTHGLAGHTHTVNAHAHTVGGHYHGKGTLNITASGAHTHGVPVTVGAAGGPPYINCDDGGNGAAAGTVTTTSETHIHANSAFAGLVGHTPGSDGDSGFDTSNTAPGTGGPSVADTGSPSISDTGGPSTATTSSTAPGTSISGPAALSIQPRSIRVRYIMRIA